MRASPLRRPLSRYLLLALLVFQGLSGVFGGAALVADPSGAILRMPLTLLEGSPFTDFAIPGLILLVVLGVGPLVVAAMVWKRNRWAWHAALLVSVALLIWIGVEVLMVGYVAEPPLQVIYGLVGAAMLAATASARPHLLAR